MADETEDVQYYGQYVRSSRKHILDTMLPDEVVDHLFADEILTQETLEEIKSAHTTYDKNDILLAHLKDSHAYERLFNALQTTNQGFLVDTIKETGRAVKEKKRLSGGQQDETDYICDEYRPEDYDIIDEDGWNKLKKIGLSTDMINKWDGQQKAETDARLKTYALSRNERPSGTEKWRHKRLNVALIGKTGTGKSATGNLLIGSDVFETSDQPDSATRNVRVMDGTLEGQPIRIIDTPGLFDTQLTHEDVQFELSKVVHDCPEGIHVFLYVHNLTTVRYTEEEQDCRQRILDWFGRRILSNTAMVMTHAEGFFTSSETLQSYVDNVSQSSPLGEMINREIEKRVVAIDNKSQVQYERIRMKENILDLIYLVLDHAANEVYTSECFEQARQLVKDRDEKQKQKQKEETEAELMRYIEAYEKAKCISDSLVRDTLQNKDEDSLHLIMNDPMQLVDELKSALEQEGGHAYNLVRQVDRDGNLQRDLLAAPVKRHAEVYLAKIENDRKKEEEEKRSQILRSIRSEAEKDILGHARELVPNRPISAKDITKKIYRHLNDIDAGRVSIEDAEKEVKDLLEDEDTRREGRSLRSAALREWKTKLTQTSQKVAAEYLMEKSHLDIYICRDKNFEGSTMDTIIARTKEELQKIMPDKMAPWDQYGEDVKNIISKVIHQQAEERLQKAPVSRKQLVLDQLEHCLEEELRKSISLLEDEEFRRELCTKVSDAMWEKYKHRIHTYEVMQVGNVLKNKIQNEKDYCEFTQGCIQERDTAIREAVKEYINARTAAQLKKAGQDDVAQVAENVYKKLTEHTSNYCRDKKQMEQMVEIHVAEHRKALEKIYVETHGTCFPEGTTVITHHRGEIAIEMLQIGDEVLTWNETCRRVEFQPIIFMGHAAPGILSQFIELHLDAGQVLRLSPSHLIPVGDTDVLIPARHVACGDYLFICEGNHITCSQVMSVSCKTGRGLFCPHTTGGTVIVNGVLASCYTDIIHPTLAHLLLSPARLLYNLLPRAWYTKLAECDPEKGMPSYLYSLRSLLI